MSATSALAIAKDLAALRAYMPACKALAVICASASVAMAARCWLSRSIVLVLDTAATLIASACAARACSAAAAARRPAASATKAPVSAFFSASPKACSSDDSGAGPIAATFAAASWIASSSEACAASFSSGA
eukprot:CAMPEP_0172757130 /NCGR_PEP_ID=MMETSP1074-20121228/163144_1 /TAXON_ID=2916 /ORGANISM="Ceratium fusus, Strain PA161109" /LENGTH=131 /DNA_ID=CAMNT_0013590509 /DNA_START=633 /DNA_END=1028 /DNA_ORIENTATION=+